MNDFNDLLQSIGISSGNNSGLGFNLDIDSFLEQQQQSVFGSDPYLEVLIHPKSSGYRFRYQSEGDSHGGIPGESMSIFNKKKTYPTIAIRNYKGMVRVALSLVSHQEPFHPHYNKLVGKDVTDGFYLVEISPETNMEASFTNLGIEHAVKKEHKPRLEQALLLEEQMHWGTDMSDMNTKLQQIYNDNREKVTQPDFIKKIEERLKTLQPYIARICFRAFIEDEAGQFTRSLLPVYSNPIQDAKAPSCRELKISRISQGFGSANGGTEIILLCDKVQKNDIEIHMFCRDMSGDISWQELGLFTSADVHHQYAISFKTPPWRDTSITQPVQVELRLRRRTCPTTFSDSVPFNYMPPEIDNYKIAEKRRKIAHFEPNPPDSSEYNTLFNFSTLQPESFSQMLDINFLQTDNLLN